MEHLVELINVLKDVEHPVLLHIHTTKGAWLRVGRGRTDPPSTAPSPFEIMDNGEIQAKASGDKTFTDAFTDALIEQARPMTRVVALTAAMPDGTGLKTFSEEFPDRCLDIGLGRVGGPSTVAAGMCKAGLKPVVAIYSTFMQRSFDQVFQEMSLQDLPVILCIGPGRAGRQRRRGAPRLPGHRLPADLAADGLDGPGG